MNEVEVCGWTGIMKLAEREGFEPSVEFPLHTLSKRAPSTTRTSLRLSGISSLARHRREHQTPDGSRAEHGIYSRSRPSCAASRDARSRTKIAPITVAGCIHDTDPMIVSCAPIHIRRMVPAAYALVRA